MNMIKVGVGEKLPTFSKHRGINPSIIRELKNQFESRYECHVNIEGCKRINIKELLDHE